MKISVSGVLAAIIVVLGLSVAFIPKYVFPICESGDLGFFSSYQPVMRCFWFGRIELFLGGLVVLSGLILFLRPTSDSYFTVGALLIGLGLVIILVSLNTVIGSTCGHMHSICQIGTKPAERIAGSLIAIFGLILMLLSGKKFEQK
jgi:hypothetical protein